VTDGTGTGNRSTFEYELDGADIYVAGRLERATKDTVEAFQRYLHLPDASPVYFALGMVAANRLAPGL